MPANVLIQTAFLGDVLLSIPLMKKMKALWPNEKLILVCRRGVGVFFVKTGVVDEVYEIKKGDSKSYDDILENLRKNEIHLLVSPHESVRTAFFVKKITAQKKISYAKYWNWLFYDQRISKDLQLPDAIRQLSLLQNFDADLAQQIQEFAQTEQAYKVSPAGKLSAVPSWASMSLSGYYSSHAELIKATLAKFHLSESAARSAVAMFPGSVWATKRWTEAGFVQTGRALREKGVAVLVMGGPGEEDLCTRVTALIPGAQNLCGQTSILESALIVSQLAAVIGNDSASMHLAATSGTPSVVVFGPTVIEFGFRPWQDQVYIVQKEGLACRPCGKHGHQVCPIGTHVCMKSLEAAEVLGKLKEILK